MSIQTSGLGFVGQSVTRIEDDRFLIGKGRFVADVQPEGGLHAAFVRSPFPHATITGVDTTEANRLAGVVAVYTGAELNEGTHPFVPFVASPGSYSPLYKPMADEKVRHIGDPVALVVAESRRVAEDAAELVVVDYDLLDGVGSIDKALAPETPQLWERADGNVLHDHTDTYGDVDAVFASADRLVTLTLHSHRQANQPMETRGTVVEIEPATGHLTIHNTSQGPHVLKWVIAAQTVDQGRLRSLWQFLRNTPRRKAFFAAAREFRTSNAADLKKQDNAAMKGQLKKDRSLLKHLGQMGLGLLAKDDYPTVTSVDIGGGFGSKGPVAREDLPIVVAAMRLGRTVQWIEDRVENLADGGHAREERFDVEIAVDDDGTMKGMRVDAIVDAGAYPSFPFGAHVLPGMWKVYMPGPYHFEAFQLRTRIVATNKGRVVPYRGPWANETFVRERAIDAVAAELGMTPADVRAKNMMTEQDAPSHFLTGPTIDETMSTRKTFERALELIDHDDMARMKADAQARNHRVGIGIASYHEAAPGPPDFADAMSPGAGILTKEDGRATVEADGRIVMYTSQVPHGQSHQTTYKQVVADEFGVSMDDVEIVWGNTDTSQFSFIGTGGSRGGPLGAGVMRSTARHVKNQMLEVAADMLEASVDDIQVVDGNIHVSGVPAHGLSFADVAGEVANRSGVSAGPVFSHAEKYEGVGNGGWSCATHVAVVDIDLDTGKVEIPRYLVVEDCGPIINPAIVDGQVRGGVAQGIGAVLYENAYYDDDANLLTSTYMDYLIPTAMEIPEIEIEHLETLTKGENDFRGVGEGGMIGAPAALTNAVSDALGIQVTEQYLPPTRILELAGVIEPDRPSTQGT
ncbi:MAG: xanthine dehydrogenase family protein molybdopterin-binding subunit [Acidimicrobiales bacterium]